MAGQLIRRGKRTWLVRVYIGDDPETGRRVYANQTVHGNKDDAEQVRNRLLLQRSSGELRPGAEKLTIGALLDDLLTDYRINEKCVWWAEMLVEKQLRPFFGELGISRLSTSHVSQFVERRKQEGKSNATINHELSLLRRALNLGKQATPPRVLRAPHIPKLKEDNVRKGFFEHGDFVKLRAELPEELRPLVTFAYFTGCRRGEILSLRWDQVDLAERIVRLEPGTTKNDEARAIPLGVELYETLSMQKAIRDAKHPECAHVFHRSGRKVGEFNTAWWGACLRAGLWQGDAKKGRPSKLFHDLRRTGVMNLVRAGVPEAVAMRISGHKTRAIFDRYNIVSEGDLRDAARRLDSYFEEQSRTQARTQEPGVSHTIRTQTPSSKIQ